MSEARVLLVSESTSTLRRWIAWLSRAGFEVDTCPGPEAAGCPRLDGDPCGRREVARLAVVDVPSAGGAELHGGWPERACTSTLDDSPTLYVVEGGIGAPLGGIHLAGPVDGATLVRAVEGTLAAAP